LICHDDQTNASLVRGLYEQLLDVDKVDLVIGGYGNNSLTPAMPLMMARQRYFVGLMGLGVNTSFDYPNYFVMIPTGPHRTRRSPKASSRSRHDSAQGL
jgi:branched-chain amino acid transport system substrate-binding protein